MHARQRSKRQRWGAQVHGKDGGWKGDDGRTSTQRALQWRRAAGRKEHMGSTESAKAARVKLSERRDYGRNTSRGASDSDGAHRCTSKTEGGRATMERSRLIQWRRAAGRKELISGIETAGVEGEATAERRAEGQATAMGRLVHGKDGRWS